MWGKWDETRCARQYISLALACCCGRLIHSPTLAWPTIFKKYNVSPGRMVETLILFPYLKLILIHMTTKKLLILLYVFIFVYFLLVVHIWSLFSTTQLHY